MAPPRKPQKNRRMRKPIQPTMDTQGVMVRNEEYIKMMMGLEALLPQVKADPHAMELTSDILKIFSNPDHFRNMGSLNTADKHLSSKATQLFLVLQKDWANTEDSKTKQAIKSYMTKVDDMAADLGTARGAPRNMKEVLARNFLGLQPQDVRTKGLAKTFLKETATDLKMLFGGSVEKEIQKKHTKDHAAVNEAETKAKKRKKLREDHEEALMDDRDFEQEKFNKVHDEALAEDRQRTLKKEKETAHGQAIDEDKRREESKAAGVPFPDDVIREKELIHSQALEMEEKAEKERQELQALEVQKTKQQEKVAKETAAKKENVKDDKVASEILGEVKAIHKLLERGGVGTGEGTGTGTGRGKKKSKAVAEAEANGQEEQIQKIMKTLGYSANDPVGRKLAEKALGFGVNTPDDASEPSFVAEDRKAAEEDAYVEQEERNRKQEYEDSIVQARIEEKENDHEHALKVNADFDRKGREQGFIADKEEAHTQALALQKQFDEERATRTNVGIDRKGKEKGYLPNSPELEERASDTNARIDEISAFNARNEAAMAGTASVAPAAPVTPPLTPTAPTTGGFMNGARNLWGRVRGFGGSIARTAGLGVGSSAVATGATVLGGLALGGAAGTWANNNLGLKSEGEEMNDAAEARALQVEQHGNEVARSRGYSSMATMQEANRSRGELQVQEQARRATVESLERQSIDESVLEPQAAPSNQPPVVNNYNTMAPPAPAHSAPQTVFIRAVHPSFMRYQEKRMSRVLYPQGTT